LPFTFVFSFEDEVDEDDGAAASEGAAASDGAGSPAAGEGLDVGLTLGWLEAEVAADPPPETHDESSEELILTPWMYPTLPSESVTLNMRGSEPAARLTVQDCDEPERPL
jgi:hypothetical protein